jgi:hypothetical protein
MDIKYFLCVLFFVFSIFAIPVSNSPELIAKQSNNSNYLLGSHTERVLIDGEWWIIEYSDNGVIVNIYKEVDD